MKPLLRGLFALAAFVLAVGASTAWAAPADITLPVPFRSQFDGSVWAESDCGPTAISMVLQAFGQNVPTVTLRASANQLLGISDPNTGTRVQDLAKVVQEHGLSVTGPYTTGGQFRQWTADDVKTELEAGRPVVAQMYYPLLPNHSNRPVYVDHYIVIVGFSGDNFIFNDPADYWGPGYHQTMTTSQMMRAWGASNVPYGGFSVGPGSSGISLLPPPPPAAPATAAALEAQPSQDAVPQAAGAAAAAQSNRAGGQQPSAQPNTDSAKAAATAAPAVGSNGGDALMPAHASSAPSTSQGQANSGGAATPAAGPLPSLSGLMDQLKSSITAATR